MKFGIILGIIVALSGCSTVKPFLEIGIGWQIDAQTDYWQQTDRLWQCSKNIPFDIEAGIETKTHWRFGLQHESWLLCGTGLNDDPEAYSAKLRVGKKWGGQK